MVKFVEIIATVQNVLILKLIIKEIMQLKAFLIETQMLLTPNLKSVITIQLKKFTKEDAIVKNLTVSKNIVNVSMLEVFFYFS